MNTVNIRLCGTTVVTDALGQAVNVAGVKPIRILEMLALEQGSPLSKELIADRLWNGNPPPSYVGSLESYISNLRRALGRGGNGEPVLMTTPRGYVLTDAADVDVIEIRSLLSESLQAAEAARPGLVLRAIVLERGRLLAGDTDSLWAEMCRSELDILFLESCTLAARSALLAGDADTARALAEAAIGRSQVAEGAWQILLQALEQLGRPVEALTAYARLREITLDQLGVEPAPACRAIYSRLLASGDGGRGGDRAELDVLVRLLRQRLESWPGIVVPDRDDHLMVLAGRVLSAA